MSKPATADPAACVVPLLGRGRVGHRRLRPTEHDFAYDSLFLLLPMRSIAANPALLRIPRRRFGAMTFCDADHGDGGDDALAWLLDLLAAHGITDADGEIWLQTFPRTWGYAFKPVSLWYCERADGRLRCAVAEVNNTFGERHCYLLLPPAPDADMPWGAEYRARKVFHVSPFCAVEGGYRFRFVRNARRLLLRIDYDDAQGPLLQTHISGALQPLTRAAAWGALLRHPLHGLRVIALIHWQALKLWCKHAPFHRKPPAPDRLVTRSTP